MAPKKRIQPKSKIDPTKIVSHPRTSRYGIPVELQRYLKQTYGWDRFKEFKSWYSKNVRIRNDEGAKIYEAFSEALQGTGLIDAAISGHRGYSANRSHIMARNLGGSGFTFLEHWVANQQRGASEKDGIPFINPDILIEAGLPTNWIELYHAWDQQQQGNFTTLGPLEDISPDDLVALHRGDTLETVFERRELLNNLVEEAANNPGTIAENSEEYLRLFAESRGMVPENVKGGENLLLAQSGFDIDADGKYFLKDSDEVEADAFARDVERFGDEGQINYEPTNLNQMTEQEVLGPEDFDDKPVGEDHTLLKALLMLTPQGRQLMSPLMGVDKLRQIWRNPTVQRQFEKIKKSDIIQNLGKDSRDASNLQKTIESSPGNELGIIQDKSLGNLIKQLDKGINLEYQKVIEDPKEFERIIDEELNPNTKWVDRHND